MYIVRIYIYTNSELNLVYCQRFFTAELFPLPLFSLFIVRGVQRRIVQLSTAKSHWIDGMLDVTANRIGTLTNDISRRPPSLLSVLHARLLFLWTEIMYCATGDAHPPSCHCHVRIVSFLSRGLFSFSHTLSKTFRVFLSPFFHAERPSLNASCCHLSVIKRRRPFFGTVPCRSPFKLHYQPAS